jgi:vacuolar-type H+-ATPase subunit H
MLRASPCGQDDRANAGEGVVGGETPRGVLVLHRPGFTRRECKGRAFVEDKILEEIQVHQNAAKRDSNSPLFMIREKEMEISGRVLAAKQEAERIVAEARRKAAETVSKAETEADEAARQHEVKRMADAEVAARQAREDVSKEASPIEAQVSERRAAAIDAVIRMVTGS